jgi:hypothetical protein
MDSLLRLIDLFNSTAKKVAGYLPQSGEDIIRLFQQLGVLAKNLNIWIDNNLGVNIETILRPLGKLAIISFNFLLNVVRQITERL